MARNTIFCTKTLLASLLAVGLAGGAQAQAPSARDIPGPVPGGYVAGNVVGSGLAATITGGGDEMRIQYTQPGAGGGGTGWGQAGRFARIVGNDGDGSPQVAYAAPAPAFAGRFARIAGNDGDGPQVAYPR